MDSMNGIPVKLAPRLPDTRWRVYAYGQEFNGTLAECRAKVADFKRCQPWHRRLRWRIALWRGRLRDAWGVLRGDYADEEW